MQSAMQMFVARFASKDPRILYHQECRQPRMIAAIALGSNLPSHFGDRAANLHEALRQLEALGHVTAVSSFHDTDPVGYEDQPRFLNAAALLETELPPLELLHALLAIEHSTRQRLNSGSLIALRFVTGNEFEVHEKNKPSAISLEPIPLSLHLIQDRPCPL